MKCVVKELIIGLVKYNVKLSIMQAYGLGQQQGGSIECNYDKDEGGVIEYVDFFSCLAFHVLFFFFLLCCLHLSCL